MTEKIKAINNPLTIIAIFAALAEINATVAISLIDKSLHYIFIWFVILFPTILVILFFITLNYNTKVMYSPSDYRDDKTFVDSLFGQFTEVSKSKITESDFTQMASDLESKILRAIEEKTTSITTSNTSHEELSKLVNSIKLDIQQISEKSIRNAAGMGFEMSNELKTAVVSWISYPAYLPIVYAIYKEGATSTTDLESVSSKYHLSSSWDSVGIKKLLDNILIGKKESFAIKPNIKEQLTKWITYNEEIIKQIINSYSKEENTKSGKNEEARAIAQSLAL